MPIETAIPADPTNPTFDILRGRFGARTNIIHEVMASHTQPLTADEIGQKAEELARNRGLSFNADTYSPQVTRSHLATMRDKRQYAEQTTDGRWRLTETARRTIAQGGRRADQPPPIASGGSGKNAEAMDLRTVDDKGRIVLPRTFANATVTVTEVSDTELRIQKAVVVPESALPLMEDALQPLSDRDRDLFLDLIENPPEPNAAFRKAAEAYKKRHG